MVGQMNYSTRVQLEIVFFVFVFVFVFKCVYSGAAPQNESDDT